MSLSLPLPILALGIFVCNLAWAVFQERVGSTNYGNERFRALPILNLVQGIVATCVGYAVLRFSKPSTPSQTSAHFVDFFRVSLSHTIASPVGYSALTFISYPLLVLVSSCKLVPVMLVSIIVNHTHYTHRDFLSAFIMTAGVLVYSLSGPSDHAPHQQGFHVEDTSLLYTSIGIGLVLTNLMLEGYTNAGQDALYRRKGSINSFLMMTCMNSWGVILLTCLLFAEGIVRGSEGMVVYTLLFANRHPEILIHMGGFALCGAVAQCFVFLSIQHYGAFVTTTITISRKFVTVLLSVVIFGHTLGLLQWAGVAAVFTGLAIQLLLNRHHSHAHTGTKQKLDAASSSDDAGAEDSNPPVSRASSVGTSSDVENGGNMRRRSRRTAAVAAAISGSPSSSRSGMSDDALGRLGGAAASPLRPRRRPLGEKSA